MAAVLSSTLLLLAASAPGQTASHTLAPSDVHPELVLRSSEVAENLVPSKNGQWYLSFDESYHKISVYSASDSTRLRSIYTGSTSALGIPAILSDSETIMVPGGTAGDGNAHLSRYLVTSGKRLPDFVLPGFKEALRVAAARDTNLVAVGVENAICVIDALSGKLLFTTPTSVWLSDLSDSLEMSSDGSVVIAAARDAHILAVWHWRSSPTPVGFRLGDKKEEDLTLSPGGDYLVFRDATHTRVYDTRSGKQVIDNALIKRDSGSIQFLSEQHFLLVAKEIGESVVIDMSTGREMAISSLPSAEAEKVRSTISAAEQKEAESALDASERFTRFEQGMVTNPGGIVFVSSPDQLWTHEGFWDLSFGDYEKSHLPAVSGWMDSTSTSRDRRYLAHALGSTLYVTDMLSRKQLMSPPADSGMAYQFARITADGQKLAVVSESTRVSEPHSAELKMWSIPDFSPIKTAVTWRLPENHMTADFELSPDGKLAAIASKNAVMIYAAGEEGFSLARTINLPAETKLIRDARGTVVKTHAWPHPEDQAVQHMQFSPDGQLLAIDAWHVHIYSTNTWKEQYTIPWAGDSNCLVFSPDGRQLALLTSQAETDLIENADLTGASLTLWDLQERRSVFRGKQFEASCPISFDGDIMAAGIEDGVGLYDRTTGTLLASLYQFNNGDWAAIAPDGLFDGTPGAWKHMQWRFHGNTFEVGPVELFFRDFYHPGLVSEIFGGARPRSLVDLESIDRRQPTVSIKQELGSVPDGIARVSLHVTQAPPDALHRSGSGARDLRLFRNGTLVRTWRGDLKLDVSGSVTFTADVPLAHGNNKLTAYVFNESDVKSSDSQSVSVYNIGTRKSVAYVLAVGINRYASDSPSTPMNLLYAEADAIDFSDVFAQSQKVLHQFDEIRVVRLLNEQATRANIVAALKILGGATKGQLTLEQQGLYEGVEAAGPDDGFFLYYAGHGTRDGSHFYLLPHDANIRLLPNDPASEAISDTDLSQLLEPISPGRAFFVIDACNSGKALDSATAVGPVNANGLAQLAYEKGLYVLAASQSMESAREASSLANGHGYLTYVLVNDGLKTAEDIDKEQQAVTLRSWFEFACRRVPELQVERISNFMGQNSTGSGQTAGRGLTIHATTRTSDLAVQHPRLFYRRELEPKPLIVAKPAVQ